MTLNNNYYLNHNDTLELVKADSNRNCTLFKDCTAWRYTTAFAWLIERLKIALDDQLS